MTVTSPATMGTCTATGAMTVGVPVATGAMGASMATGACSALGTGTAMAVCMVTGAFMALGTATAMGVCMVATGASMALGTSMATQATTLAGMATPLVHDMAKDLDTGAATLVKPSGNFPEMKINSDLASTD